MGANYSHLWHVSLGRSLPSSMERRGEAWTTAGQTVAGSSSAHEMRYVRFGVYPFLGMTCPGCGSEIACGFLGCLAHEALFFYDSTGTPWINALSHP